MEGGERAELSHQESFVVGKRIWKAAFILGSVLAVVSLALRWKWYISVPAGLVLAYLGVMTLTVLIAQASLSADGGCGPVMKSGRPDRDPGRSPQ